MGQRDQLERRQRRRVDTEPRLYGDHPRRVRGRRARERDEVALDPAGARQFRLRPARRDRRLGPGCRTRGEGPYAAMAPAALVPRLAQHLRLWRQPGGRGRAAAGDAHPHGDRPLSRGHHQLRRGKRGDRPRHQRPAANQPEPRDGERGGGARPRFPHRARAAARRRPRLQRLHELGAGPRRASRRRAAAARGLPPAQRPGRHARDPVAHRDVLARPGDRARTLPGAGVAPLPR